MGYHFRDALSNEYSAKQALFGFFTVGLRQDFQSSEGATVSRQPLGHFTALKESNFVQEQDTPRSKQAS